MKKDTVNSSKIKNTTDKTCQIGHIERKVQNSQTSQELVKTLNKSDRGKIMYNYYHLKDGGVEVKEGEGINFSDIVDESRLEGVKEYFILKDSVALYLCRNKIGPQGAEIIANNIILKNNSMLYLSENNIGNAGAIILANKLELEEGVTLDLSYNEIGYSGIEALACKLELKKGVTLNLSGNHFGYNGAKTLADNLELKEGVTLNLGNNQIGDEGVKELIDNLELKQGVTLILGFNKISDTMKQKLKAREKSYKDRGINCNIQVKDFYQDGTDNR